MIRWAWLAVLVCVGCGAPKPSTAPPPPAAASNIPNPPADPEAEVFEKLRSGAYQFDAALGTLGDAVEALRPLPSGQPEETKEALLDVLDQFDSAGKVIGEYSQAPDKAAPFAQQDERRLKAIEEISDSIRELRDAQGTVGDLLEAAPPAREKAALEKADAALDDTLDALEEGVKSLGGTPPPDEDDPTLSAK